MIREHIKKKREVLKPEKSSKLKVHIQVESPPGQWTGPSKCHLNMIVTLRSDPGCFSSYRRQCLLNNH